MHCINVLFKSWPLFTFLFIDSGTLALHQSFSHTTAIVSSSLYLSYSFSFLSLPLLFSPWGQQLQIQTLLSLSRCHSFKQHRQSGHRDEPGASVTVASQVNISQRVLDDTLSVSPISLLN